MEHPLTRLTGGDCPGASSRRSKLCYDYNGGARALGSGLINFVAGAVVCTHAETDDARILIFSDGAGIESAQARDLFISGTALPAVKAAASGRQQTPSCDLGEGRAGKV